MSTNRDRKMRTEIKLTANVGTGEGDIKIMPHFEQMHSLWQLDVLQDWIADLTNEYDRRICIRKDEIKEIRRKSKNKGQKHSECNHHSF